MSARVEAKRGTPPGELPDPEASEAPSAEPAQGNGAGRGDGLARRHLCFGWWAILVWLTFGIVLESLHGFKVSWYLGVQNDTRRHLFTLAHAHGTLLGLVNVALGLTIERALAPRHAKLASTCFLAGSLAVPAGFFLGGIVTYGGDPGLPVILVPLGAPLLLVATFLIARGI